MRLVVRLGSYSFGAYALFPAWGCREPRSDTLKVDASSAPTSHAADPAPALVAHRVSV
jgi:hypothetical protein